MTTRIHKYQEIFIRSSTVAAHEVKQVRAIVINIVLTVLVIPNVGNLSEIDS